MDAVTPESFDLLSIFLRADWVVKLVMIGLAVASLWSWTIILDKMFRFADWRATMAFVNAVSDVANEVDHHPDLELGWGRCTVRWSTHDAGGITQNDLACAARTELVARRSGAK